MPTDQNNDRYSVPVSRGGEPYDQYINANFDALATAVPDSGPLSERPDPSNDFAPKRYYATDDQIESINTGSSWRTHTVSAQAVQAARDGHVVAIAPGYGIAQAIAVGDNTPIQSAIDAIEDVGNSHDGRYGAGTVLLPPGEIQTPGGIAALAGKTIRGWGIQSSIVTCTGSSQTCFTLGGEGSNMRNAKMTDFCVSGGDRSGRSTGSAISGSETSSNSLTTSMIDSGFNLGRMLFADWGGPDPVIEGTLGFSNRWKFVKALNYDGSLYVGGGHDFYMGQINANHGSFDTPVIKIDGANGAVNIDQLNIGGTVGRTLYIDQPYSRYASVHVGHVNSEPDSSGGGTLSSAPAPVEIYGAPPVSIASISQDSSITSDYIVAIGGSQNYSSSNNDGPANNQIGSILYGDNASTNKVGVLAAPKSPSWYWGTGTEVDYGGFASSAVIPMADVSTA